MNTTDCPLQPVTKLTFKSRGWYVPSESRAMEGWVEGRPTQAMWASTIARVRRERENWEPTREAWDQLLRVQDFVGRRIRVQFWNPAMLMLNDEDWPHPVEADCQGVVTMLNDGFVQAYLVLRRVMEIKTGGMSGTGYLVERPGYAAMLAPLADVYEIEAAREATPDRQR